MQRFGKKGQGNVPVTPAQETGGVPTSTLEQKLLAACAAIATDKSSANVDDDAASQLSQPVALALIGTSGVLGRGGRPEPDLERLGVVVEAGG